MRFISDNVEDVFNPTEDELLAAQKLCKETMNEILLEERMKKLNQSIDSLKGR